MRGELFHIALVCAGWVGEIIAVLWEGGALFAGLGFARDTAAPHRQRFVAVRIRMDAE